LKKGKQKKIRPSAKPHKGTGRLKRKYILKKVNLSYLQTSNK